jgi:hypothetical protein
MRDEPSRNRFVGKLVIKFLSRGSKEPQTLATIRKMRVLQQRSHIWKIRVPGVLIESSVVVSARDQMSKPSLTFYSTRKSKLAKCVLKNRWVFFWTKKISLENQE